MGVLVWTWLVPAAEAQPRGDVAAHAGWWLIRTERAADEIHRDRSTGTGQAGLTAGWYIAPHLRAEADVLFTGTAVQFVQRRVHTPDPRLPQYESFDARITTRAYSGALAWQFGDNAWVHPFVLAGASVEVVRQRQESRSSPSGPRGATATVETSTDTTLRPVLGAGVKLYVTPRTFVRTEGRVSFDHRRRHVNLRIGVGLDF